MKRVVLLVVVIAGLAAACGDSGDPQPAPTGGPLPTATTGPHQPGIALVMEEVDLGDGIMTQVPSGWDVPDENFARIYRPPEGSDLDRFVTLWWVDTACGGACVERTSAEWLTTIREGEFAQFDDLDAFTILRDEEGDGSLLVQAENNFDVVSLTIARWADGAGEYLGCRASVESDNVALLAEFEAACFATRSPVLGG